MLDTKIMRLDNIISIELDGLSKTIIQYTNNTYIRSYANQLSNLEEPLDYEKVGILVDRLYEWYSTEIERIKNSEYVIDKESHFKSVELLADMKIILNKQNK